MTLVQGYDHSHKRFVSGLTTSLMQFAVQITTSIVIVPLYITKLGYELYYIIPLVTSVSAYLTVLSSVLNTSYARIVGVGTVNSTPASIERAISTVTLVYAVLATVVLVLAFVLPVTITGWLRVPAGREREVSCFVSLYLLSVAIAVMSGNYGSVLYALGRIDQRNRAEILGLNVRTGLIIAMLVLFPGNLIPIGLSFVIGMLVTIAGEIHQLQRINSMYLQPPRSFDITCAHQMVQFSGWLILNHIGAVLLTRTDIVFARYLGGGVAAGVYGALLNWTALIRTALGVVVNVLTPRLFHAQRGGDIEYMRTMAVRSSRLIGFAFALPVGLICGFAGPLLSLWLGSGSERYAPILIGLVGHFALTLPLVIVMHMSIAMDKVRLPACVSLASGVLSIILMWLFGGYYGMGMLGIAIGVGVALILKDTWFAAWYLGRLLKMQSWVFGSIALKSAVASLGIALIARAFHAFGGFGARTTLMVGMPVIVAGYVAITWNMALTPEERSTIRLLSNASKAA